MSIILNRAFQRSAFIVAIVALMLAGVVLQAKTASAQTTTVTTANGTWTLYPAQPTTYQTRVNQPINADGTSIFNAKRGVIPVSFSLSTALGAPVFQSIGSDISSANDYSFLSFVPNTGFTFNDLTGLSAVYAFTTGDCHGGALRWSVSVPGGSVFIYYGAPPQFGSGGTGGCTPTSPGGLNGSGSNMINMADLRYDTSQVGGTFYDTYSHTQTLVGSSLVSAVTLALDGGWAGDQILNLGNTSVSTTSFTDNFVASSGLATATCSLPPAQIQVTKVSGGDPGPINEVLSVSAADTTGSFRVIACKYFYNLDVSTLKGAGGYSVSAIINGTPVTAPATFTLK